jgi:hypothetical protein
VKARKLDRYYDPELLRAELAIAQAHAGWIEGASGDEVWYAIPLVSRHGDQHSENAIRYWNWQGDESRQFQLTEVAQRCPHLLDIIAEFQCIKERVRLMRVPSQQRILPHVDIPGKARLHVPIVTHPDVEFRIEGTRIVMDPGELWEFDLTREHEVLNASPIDRVHLVLDLVPNDWLAAFVKDNTVHTVF